MVDYLDPQDKKQCTVTATRNSGTARTAPDAALAAQLLSLVRTFVSLVP
jgi:hypothetical protein